MKATIEQPVERMVTLVMTEDEARKLSELMYNTDTIKFPIAHKVFYAIKEIL